ncbi:putative zinc finger SWIM domain-containing protein 7-like isoform X1 [Capsicum annuum]|nr:putative zinc finger SWIM domain-containing protein 7-like isoform X1 [Capsicum annuum]
MLETVVVAIFRPKTIKLLNATHQQVDARRRRLSVRAHRWKPCLPIWGFGTWLSDLVYLTLCHSQIGTMKPPIPPLAGPAPGAIPSMSLQRNLPMSNNHMPGSGAPNLPVSSSYNFSLGQKADASTYWREFTSPGENLHASDFGSISVVKTSSPGADGLLVSAHDAKSSPIAVSPAANLPTIVALESSSLSGNVSSPMIGTVEMKNSSEPALPAVANSEKIGIAVTLGNSVAPPVHVFRFICYKFASGLCCFLFGIQFFCSFETTTTQVTVVYGDGFSSKNRENVKKDVVITEIGGTTPSDEKIVELGPLVYESKAEEKSTFKTLLESANIGSDCMWNQAMRAVINDRRYGAVKSLCEQKQAFNEYLSQKRKLEAEERRVKQKKAREDFRKHAKALEEQKRNRVEYLEFLKSFDFIKASSQWWKVQDRLETDERCSRLEKINRLEIFQRMLVVEVVTPVTVVVMVSEECVEVDDVLVVVSDVWKLMMCRWLLVVVVVLIDELVGSRDQLVAVDGGDVGGRGVHGSIWYLDDKSQIKDAVRMAEIGLTLAWMLDDFKVAIAKYISSPPMSDTNLKVLHKMSGLSAKALVVLPCYVSLEVGQFVIAKLANRRKLLHRRNGRTGNPSSEIGK